MDIRDYKFYDNDIYHATINIEGWLELELKKDTEAIILNEEDVKEMAIYFGLIERKETK